MKEAAALDGDVGAAGNESQRKTGKVAGIGSSADGVEAEILDRDTAGSILRAEHHTDAASGHHDRRCAGAGIVPV